MSLTGGQLVVRALEDERVPFAFGIPGTHNIELYDALVESERVRAVLVTDEQGASFMADGVWRASGQLGCVNVVPGAGLTHALSGIAEAYLDNVPMLVLGCGIRRDTGMGYQLHDIDQVALVAPVTKAQFRVERGDEAYAVIRRACAVSRGGVPGPVFVEVPANVYLFKHETRGRGDTAPHHATPRRGDAGTRGRGDTRSPGQPDPVLVQQCAELLRSARRPLLYLGFGAVGAGRDLVTLAEQLGAPVATTFTGKGVFPESHPLFLWCGFGDAAPPFARAIARACDATLAIGCRFGEVATGSYGMRPPQPLIHVDIDEHVIGRNYPVELGIVSDAAAFVRALLHALPRPGPVPDPDPDPDPQLRVTIARGHESFFREALDQGDERRVSPARLLRGLQAILGPDTIFTADSGNGMFLAMELLRLSETRKFLAPVDYSCMGYSVPAAVGAKLARPECAVVALAGDGAFLMTGLELITAAGQAAAVIVVVLRDRELAQIAQFQQAAFNRTTCSELGDYDLATLCAALSVECLRLDSNAEIESVVRRAQAAATEQRPVVLDVAIDYSRKTYFTRGVVKTNLGRLPWPDRLRFVGRALGRRLFD